MPPIKLSVLVEGHDPITIVVDVTDDFIKQISDALDGHPQLPPHSAPVLNVVEVMVALNPE